MDIRPIDFNGMIQNTVEVSNTRVAEEQRPAVQQEFMSMATQQEAEVTNTGSKEKLKDGSVRVKTGHPSFHMTI